MRKLLQNLLTDFIVHLHSFFCFVSAKSGTYSFENIYIVAFTKMVVFLGVLSLCSLSYCTKSG